MDSKQLLPPTVNDTETVAVFRDATTAVLEGAGPVEVDQRLYSEDFGRYLEKVPGAPRSRRFRSRTTPGGVTVPG